MKVLGVDYGRRKVGVAVGDTETRLSEPLAVVPLSEFEDQVNRWVSRLGVGQVVVGLTGGVLDKEIRRLGAELAAKSCLPVTYFDETLTTQEAQKKLINLGKSRKKRHQKEDAVAAALMLQYFLEGGA